MDTYQASRYQNILIYAALFCLGYIASLFLTYGFIVMPGLSIIDDRAFVAAFQGLESRFATEPSGYANIPAMIAFPGVFLFGILAFIMKWKKKYSRWIIAALLLFVVGMISTALVNLPSNVAIYTAGDPNLIDVTQVRADFNETAWANWNHFRTVTTILAMVCLMRVLNIKGLVRNESVTNLKIN